MVEQETVIINPPDSETPSEPESALAVSVGEAIATSAQAVDEAAEAQASAEAAETLAEQAQDTAEAALDTAEAGDVVLLNAITELKNLLESHIIEDQEIRQSLETRLADLEASWNQNGLPVEELPPLEVSAPEVTESISTETVRTSEEIPINPETGQPLPWFHRIFRRPR